MRASTFDIAILGLGVRIPAQITIEAIEVLKQCRRGFVVALDDASIRGFEEAIRPFFSGDETLPELTSLTPTYRKDRLRRENYLEAKELVLSTLEQTRPVAYLTPGNPMVADTVAQEILEGARLVGYTTITVPGISSVDTLLADLQQEMMPGTQIYEASWLVGAKLKLDTNLSCILMQISLFGTNFPVIGGRRPAPHALIELRDYLLQSYPADHMIVLVRSGSAWNEAPNIFPVTLGNLAEAPAEAQLGSSMYIPPLHEPKFEPRLLERMTSAENHGSMYPELKRPV